MAAKGGDVQAARELRAWKAEHQLVDESIKLEDQPAVIRQRLLKRLLAELAEEDAQEGWSGISGYRRDRFSLHWTRVRHGGASAKSAA